MGTCHHQKEKSCVRPNGRRKYACAYTKVGGATCGGDHSKSEHDVAKHGN
jgi:hypothetical protein